MRLLVFGRTGQVASELARHDGVTALGREQADLTDPAACAAVIRDAQADAIINAAAYTAVDKAEAKAALAGRINGDAPAAMAQAAAAKGIPFLHVSTDYVFDGHGARPWGETDPVAPINAYGRSKLAGEEGVRAAGGAHVILRTSWVFSAHGSNFVKTMLRLAQSRDALDVVGDQIGGPTPADTIAAALVTMARALAQGHAGGTYHFAGQPPVSWAGFAREIFSRAGAKVAVKAITTPAYPTPAKRPGNSRLNCDRIKNDFGISAPDWRAGLDRVLSELERTTR